MWRRSRSLSPLRESEHQHQPNFTFNKFVFVSTHSDDRLRFATKGRASRWWLCDTTILSSFAQPPVLLARSMLCTGHRQLTDVNHSNTGTRQLRLHLLVSRASTTFCGHYATMDCFKVLKGRHGMLPDAVMNSCRVVARTVSPGT